MAGRAHRGRLATDNAMPDPSFLVPLLLQSAVIPAATVVAVWLPAKRLLKGSTHASLQAARTDGAAFPVLPAVAVACGFLAAFFATFHAQWSLPPGQALDWLPWIVAAALAQVAIARHRRARKLLSRLAVTGVALVVTAWPALPGLGIGRVGALVGVGTVLILSAQNWRTGPQAVTPTRLLPLTVISGCAGLAMLLDSSQVLGQLGGALGMALLGLVAVGVLQPRSIDAQAVQDIAILILGVLLANAWLYADLPVLIIGFLAVGLLAGALIQYLDQARTGESRKGLILARACSLLCGAATLLLAVRAAQESGGY
jgi:hypothetical protein